MPFKILFDINNAVFKPIINNLPVLYNIMCVIVCRFI